MLRVYLGFERSAGVSAECQSVARDTECDAKCGMEEILEFCFKEFAAVCLFWNFFVLYYSNNITYHPKEVYAYCGNSFLRQYYAA